MPALIDLSSTVNPQGELLGRPSLWLLSLGRARESDLRFGKTQKKHYAEKRKNEHQSDTTLQLLEPVQ